MSYLLCLWKCMRFTSVAVVFYLLCVCTRAQTTLPRQTILIDRSGSMEGFFATGEMEEVRNLLRELCGSGSAAYYFVDRDLVPVGQETAEFGSNTYLSNAL